MSKYTSERVAQILSPRVCPCGMAALAVGFLSLVSSVPTNTPMRPMLFHEISATLESFLTEQGCLNLQVRGTVQSELVQEASSAR